MNKLIENNAQMMYEVCLALDVFEKNTKVIVFNGEINQYYLLQIF